MNPDDKSAAPPLPHARRTIIHGREARQARRAGALRDLHPGIFDLDRGGADPRVLESTAELASRMARDLRALMGASDAADRARAGYAGHQRSRERVQDRA